MGVRRIKYFLKNKHKKMFFEKYCQETNTEKLEEYFLIEYSKQNKPTISKKKTSQQECFITFKSRTLSFHKLSRPSSNWICWTDPSLINRFIQFQLNKPLYCKLIHLILRKRPLLIILLPT